MIAHVFHDKNGTISSVVFQGSEVAGGEVVIESQTEGESVTAVDLGEISPDDLRRLARDIRTGFRLDSEQGTLEKLE